MLPTLAAAQDVALATRLFAEARYDEARSEFDAVQRAQPRNAVAAYHLGRLAMMAFDAEDAVRRFERAVEIEGGNALYHAWLGNALGIATQLASPVRQPFLARRVRREWERAVALDPEQIDARFSLLEFYAIAPAFMGGGKGKARDQAAALAARSPLRGAMALGVLADHGGTTEEAEAAYRKAIAIAPDSLAPVVSLVDALLAAKRSDAALGALEAYRERRPADPWVAFHVGRVCGSDGIQAPRGADELARFIAAPPPDAFALELGLAHYWSGRLAERLGKPDAAREHYRSALKVNPRSRLARKALDQIP